MSTRCTIHFHYQDQQEPDAIIYQHCDGYPDSDQGVLKELEAFFAYNEETFCGPRALGGADRYDDPSYLAARFVAWKSAQNPDGLGVGVMLTDPGDIAYRYHIRCRENGKRPEVSHEAAR